MKSANTPAGRQKNYTAHAAMTVLAFFLCYLMGPQTLMASGYMGSGAGAGALLGAVFGDDFDEVIDGALTGAVVGGVADAAVASDRREAAEARNRTETQQQMAEQQRQLEAQNTEMADDAIVEAVGKDNWEGYKALRACNHERAYALAKAGATSSRADYQLAASWLEAVTALDERVTEKSEPLLKELVQKDPDIDTVQQASIAADKILLGMREERREIGIGPCR